MSEGLIGDEATHPTKRRVIAQLDYSRTVTILVGEDKKEFNVHTEVLSQSSPFFAAALSARWSKEGGPPLELPEDESELFNVFVGFAYCGELVAAQSCVTEWECRVLASPLNQQIKYLESMIQDLKKKLQDLRNLDPSSPCLSRTYQSYKSDLEIHHDRVLSLMEKRDGSEWSGLTLETAADAMDRWAKLYRFADKVQADKLRDSVVGLFVRMERMIVRMKVSTLDMIWNHPLAGDDMLRELVWENIVNMSAAGQIKHGNWAMVPGLPVVVARHLLFKNRDRISQEMPQTLPCHQID